MLTAIEANTALGVNYIQALRIIAEELTTLPPKSFQLLLFICSRTLRFGKDKERIPLKHFTDGIKDSTGKWVQKPVGVAKNAISDGLIALEDAGLINVTKAHANVRVIQINAEIFSDGVDHMESRLRKSKKERLSEQNTEESYPVVSPNEGNQFPQNRETSFPKLGQPNITNRSITNRFTKGAKAHVEQIIKNAEQRSVSKPIKVAKHKAGIQLFHTLVKENFPSWKLISTTAAATRNFRLATENLTQDEITAFVTHTVENWVHIVTNNLKYLTKNNANLPSVPCFNTFGMCSAKFLQDYVNTSAAGDRHSVITVREVKQETARQVEPVPPRQRYKTATHAERYGTGEPIAATKLKTPKEIPQHVLDFNRRAEELAERDGISLIEARTKLALGN